MPISRPTPNVTPAGGEAQQELTPARPPHRAPAGDLSGSDGGSVSDRLKGERFQRKAALTPSVQPTGQRPDPGDASALEQQRHPGAGRLIGSTTIDDHVALPRELYPALLQVLDGEPDGTRERVRREPHVDGACEIWLEVP